MPDRLPLRGGGRLSPAPVVWASVRGCHTLGFSAARRRACDAARGLRALDDVVRLEEGLVSMESVVVALIGGAVTLAGVVASNSRNRAVMEQKIDELTRRVEKHNCLVERTYLLERDTALLKNDVEALERKVDRDE
jgi:outer membrane murein-binding lipoprotein Lpp